MSTRRTLGVALRGSGAAPAPGPVWEELDGSAHDVGGGLTVRRVLPLRARRRIGAWCFLDHIGPVHAAAMRVPPHPHIGLQTVTWLFEGEVLHLDTLGSRQPIRPGQLNWMTAGRGIAHVELSEAGPLHGVQLWVALPDDARHTEPAFAHHANLPVVERDGARLTVLAGTLDGHTSPATAYSPLLGVDAVLSGGANAALPLDPSFEHGVLVVAGSVEVDGRPARVGTLVYLGTGRTSLTLTASADARLVLIGGAPLDEEILLWWNLIARHPDEITAAREAWAAGAFGEVPGFDGPPLPAPPIAD